MMLRILILALAAGFALAVPPPDLSPAMAREKMDSLRRHLDSHIFSASEQKDWRQCQSGKRDFLQTGRKADPAFAEVDSLLKASKLARRNPSDPDVARLLEKKFLLENGLEQRWLASPQGKGCGRIETNRRNRLEKSLENNPDYRKWKKISEVTPETPPAPI